MARFSFWKNAFVSCALLLGVSFAGRQREIARNKGFHPRAVEDFHEANLRARAEQANTKPKYLNDNTKSKLCANGHDIKHQIVTELQNSTWSLFLMSHRASCLRCTVA